MFEVATVPRSAADGEPIPGILADEKLSGDADLIDLKGVFSSGDSSYSFELKSDGTGVIIYSDFIGDAEEFDHEINVENLQREIEEATGEESALRSRQNALNDSEIQSIREEIQKEKLEEVFWEEINQSLETRFSARFTTARNGAKNFKRHAARSTNLSSFWNCAC